MVYPAVKRSAETINPLRIHCFGAGLYVYQYFFFTSLTVCRIFDDHRVRQDFDEMFGTAYGISVPLERHVFFRKKNILAGVPLPAFLLTHRVRSSTISTSKYSHL